MATKAASGVEDDSDDEKSSGVVLSRGGSAKSGSPRSGALQSGALQSGALQSGPSQSAVGRPLPSSSRRSGLFTIYKHGQGYWTRMGTVGGAILIALLALGFLYQQLPVLFNPIYAPQQNPGMTAAQVEASQEHAHALVMETTYGICAAFVVGFGLLVFFLMNKPTNADFLIATDSEMKKVNWTTREELVGSTKVVIAFMFLVAIFLFGLDVLFAYFFKVLTVLKAGPFG